MKAIVVTDQAAGTAGMKLVERPEPQAAIFLFEQRGLPCVSGAGADRQAHSLGQAGRPALVDAA